MGDPGGVTWTLSKKGAALLFFQNLGLPVTLTLAGIERSDGPITVADVSISGTTFNSAVYRLLADRGLKIVPSDRQTQQSRQGRQIGPLLTTNTLISGGISLQGL